MLTKPLYWFLSFTWGIIMTLVGLIVTLFLKCCGHKPRRNVYGWYTEVGGDFGGVSFGPFSVVSVDSDLELLNHEFGHSVQNCFFGPLFIFVVAIPSFTRYWYREYLVRAKKKKYSQLPDYDAVWFERGATRLGNLYYIKGKR